MCSLAEKRPSGLIKREGRGIEVALEVRLHNKVKVENIS
jgi:hypothetical protein